MTVPTYPDASAARLEEGRLTAVDGVALAFRRYTPPEPRATVVVAPGGGDHAGRYPALTTALVEAGCEVALLDFRGHGRSGGRRWHVNAFDDYLGDLDAFVAHARERAAGRPLFVVGHSNGGLVAATWALGPGRGIAGLVLSSPWLRLRFTPPRVKVAAARLLDRVVPWLPVPTGLRSDQLTTDPALQRWTDEDPLYLRAASPRFFLESQRAQALLVAEAARLTCPVLVLVGEEDPIADPATSRAFLAAAGSADKELHAYPGLLHELFNERERARPIADAVAWILQRSLGR